MRAVRKSFFWLRTRPQNASLDSFHEISIAASKDIVILLSPRKDEADECLMQARRLTSSLSSHYRVNPFPYALKLFLYTRKLSIARSIVPATQLEVSCQDYMSSQAQDFYAILGLSPNVSMADIKRAYRDHVRRYHPDRLANALPAVQAAGEEQTKKINGAYEVLSDQTRRAQYHLTRPRDGGSVRSAASATQTAP